MTNALLEMSQMVYLGQGRSRLKSVSDASGRSPYKCSVCADKFNRGDDLRQHLFQQHSDQLGPNMKRILEKYSDLASFST